MPFQIGDRVEQIQLSQGTWGRAGATGVVRHEGRIYTSVEYDEPVSGGHCCDGHAPNGNALYILRDCLVLRSPADTSASSIGEFFRKQEQIRSAL